MYLSKKNAVPPHIYQNAKHYIEEQKIIFFDFFRNCAFGFVLIDEKKGHYVHTFFEGNEITRFNCRCERAIGGQICAHVLALFLKAWNWPVEKDDLTARFEEHYLPTFFKAVGRGLYKVALHAESEPSLTIPEAAFEERYLAYLGFGSGNPKVAERDGKMLATAKTMTRTTMEGQLLKKGLPSAKVMFEESRLYALNKLFFQLDRHNRLKVRVEALPDHEVRLVIASLKADIFSWRMPIDTFLKGIQSNLNFWMRKTEFTILKQALPVVYRIQFLSEGHLEIEPMVALGGEHFAPLEQVILPGNKNLYFHEALGYFRIQIGLSPFEMHYSDPKLSRVNKDRVPAFLKEHLSALKALDRSLFDEALLGEVIVDRLDAFRLELLSINDGRFEIRLSATIESKAVTADALRTCLAEKGRYVKLAGRLFDTQSYDASYLRTVLDAGDAVKAGDLLRIEAFFKDRLKVVTNDNTAEVYERLKNFRDEEPPSLDDTRLSLRPYQQLGYEWLSSLNNFGLGGLLCDQMGLGKTHQGMALIASIAQTRKNARILIVAPTSVIYHWEDKLNHFCPKIKVKIHHGPDRDTAKALKGSSVLVSTYGTMRNDAQAFAGTLFDLIVFDEAQNLKNKQTKAHSAISKLKGSCKVGLTGTPIENQISELKSLVDLVLPGYLGSDSYFQRYFSEPIVRFKDEKAKTRLKNMVSPFILRRSKKEVLIDLPEKTEDKLAIGLHGYEQELYKEVKQRGKDQAGDQPSFVHIFQLIDKLKQVCNHPSLYHQTVDYEAYPSTKWQSFSKLLVEAVEGGEKVVVFSQYLKMIEMFGLFLDDLGIAHAGITGATRDRREQVARFQEDPACRVFLGSINAAGVGIDLTAGSVMIHYDRWWNPAREEQATDRIHRIGQKNAVQIYKYVARGTIEERIDRIIERKRHLLEDLVSFDDAAMRKSFTLDELLDVLA